MAMSMSTTSGLNFLARATALRPSSRLGDDLQIVFKFKHLAQAFADDHVVFGKQHGGFFRQFKVCFQRALPVPLVWQWEAAR